MRHPSDGTLRRLVDEPDGVADTDHDHIAGCPACQTTLAGVRHDARTAATALTSHVEEPDIDAGWHRLSATIAAGTPAGQPVSRQPVSRGGAGWRTALRRPAVAITAAVALLSGATAAAATDWLQIFRTEQIAPVTISQADLLKLPDLSGYGDVKLTEPARIRAVPDAMAAQETAGLAVPQVAQLPGGVTGQPQYQAGDRVSAEFTFSAAKAARAAADAGHTLPPMPAGLDGSRFRLTAGPGVAAVWNSGQGVPALIVGRAVAPAAYSDGVPFATARDYLLSLSGLPQDVAAQLRGFTGDGRTMPVHVLAEELSSAPADVGGIPATVLTSKDQVLAAVVWVRDGVVTVVAGSLTADEVLTVARGLR
ncbi:hypothetical protein [Actinoplanes sp. DH11]|uniref:hypothetical protein n=1 Tax=Actinoplanes sp. DH11 TaxID=2857011 RepID=UPI001E52BAF7|nr:hypothetical protein [Actinoplanes sp. DH11]